MVVVSARGRNLRAGHQEPDRWSLHAAPATALRADPLAAGLAALLFRAERFAPISLSKVMSTNRPANASLSFALKSTEAYLAGLNAEGIDVAVTDALVPFVPSLIGWGYSESAMASFLQDLAARIAWAEPTVLYLDDDPALAVPRAIDREGPEWKLAGDQAGQLPGRASGSRPRDRVPLPAVRARGDAAAACATSVAGDRGRPNQPALGHRGATLCVRSTRGAVHRPRAVKRFQGTSRRPTSADGSAGGRFTSCSRERS